MNLAYDLVRLGLKPLIRAENVRKYALWASDAPKPLAIQFYA